MNCLSGTRSTPEEENVGSVNEEEDEDSGTGSTSNETHVIRHIDRNILACQICLHRYRLPKVRTAQQRELLQTPLWDGEGREGSSYIPPVRCLCSFYNDDRGQIYICCEVFARSETLAPETLYRM